MQQGTTRRRVVADLRAPLDTVAGAWPTSRRGRRVAAVLTPVLAVLVASILWVIGIVVVSLVAAIGVEPVDLEGSDAYARDAVLFIGCGLLTCVVLVAAGSVWRAAIERSDARAAGR
jgi:hypothetical protein